MGKKKSRRPKAPSKTASQEGGTSTWNVSSQSAIVTIWECHNEAGELVYAVTFNQKGSPVPRAADEKGAKSVMQAFQRVERSDSLKQRDSLGLD